jgi:hypothetical protein
MRGYLGAMLRPSSCALLPPARLQKGNINITKFTNLSKIIIAAALKKYKTFTDYYDYLFTDCLIEVLDNLFVKKKYNKEKSRLSSYIFEISR